MIMPGVDGKPVMSYRDWLPDESSLDKLQRKARQGAQALSGALDAGASKVGANSPNLMSDNSPSIRGGLSSKKVYKWKDEFGQWHFTDDPAVAQNRGKKDSAVEQQALSYPANVMEAPAPATSRTKEAPSDAFEPSLQNVPKVLDEAHRVKDLLEQRYRDTEQL